LELSGHGYVFDVEERVGKLTRRVDQRMLEYFPKTLDESHLRRYVGIPNWKHEAGAYSAVLSRPVWDLMERRGKHWRPIFGLLMLEAFGIPSRPFETLISVVAELSHTGSLIIDDIEDDSHLRRGGKCIHLRYGLDIAINAANTAYFLPYLLLREHPLLSGRQRLALYRILSEQSVRSHFGQGVDIFWSRKLTERRLRRWMSDSLSPKILQTYAYKTGALLEGLAEIAAVIARADAATRQACSSFAATFGVAFQIVDDVLGLTEPGKLRKNSGEDIARGKITYAMLRTFERLPPPERRRLQAIFCSRELRSDPATREEALALVRRSGALEACRQEALAMVDQAWARLARKLAPSEPRTMLRVLCTHLLV
jgi:geranylgeranyl pyrophosphate synthase